MSKDRPSHRSSGEHRDLESHTLDEFTWVLGRISGTEPLARIYCEAAPGGDPDPIIDAFAEWLLG